ncbi:MAG: hypothetical protein JKY08_06735 [Flavobacteriaceae bacterium]|nr:hypothetical protein [Flavobacteriaceae bacterium]
MSYYSAKHIVTTKGTYCGFIAGGYVFNLENEDMIDFTAIKGTVLEAFDLHLPEFKNKKFELTYSENFTHASDDDIAVFTLVKLELLTQ